MSFLKKIFGGSGPRHVSITPAGVELEVGSGETILERALKEGLAFPHDCTVGTCGSCRTKLISGRVEAITPFGYTLSKEELAADYILACQAIPKEDCVVKVELHGPGEEIVATPARLSGTEELTHDILRVSWETEKPVAYRAGQYMNVRWNGGEIHRSYSFASAPAEGGSTRLSTFVRLVPGGAFTEPLFKGELADASFELDGPHGEFWLRHGEGPMLCIAGGSGLAPIVSLLEDAAVNGVSRDCILLFGGRGARDLYGQQEIEAIRSRWGGRFEYWPALSETPEQPYREGFITDHIAPALAALGEGAQAYMCGPPVMIDAAIPVLTENGVSLDEIYYDKFTDASTATGAGAS